MKDISRSASEISKKAPLVILLAAALAVTVYLSWRNHADFKAAMVRQAQAQLMVAAKAEAQSIQMHIENIDRELSILSFDYILHKALAEKDAAAYSRILRASYQDVGKLVEALYLIGPDGLILAAWPESGAVKGRDASLFFDVKEAFSKKKGSFSNVFVTESGKKAISDIHPIFEQDKVIGFVRAVILIEKINDLIAQIGETEQQRAFLLNNSRVILGSSDSRYAGADILDFIDTRFSGKEALRLRQIVHYMLSGRQGVSTFRYAPTPAHWPVESLLAFCPVFIGSQAWSVAVGLDYDVVAGPIIRNTRYNLLFSGCIVALFLVFAFLLYRLQKKKSELSVSAAALNIINRELHLEIDERKKIEKELECVLYGHSKKRARQEEG